MLYKEVDKLDKFAYLKLDKADKFAYLKNTLFKNKTINNMYISKPESIIYHLN